MGGMKEMRLLLTKEQNDSVSLRKFIDISHTYDEMMK